MWTKTELLLWLGIGLCVIAGAIQFCRMIFHL